MKKVTSIPLKNILIFLLIFIILSAVYYPAIQGYYGHHDDYYFWIKTPNGLHVQHEFVVYLGRFLGAELQTMAGRFIHSLRDLNYLRFVSVFCISLCAFSCYFWFRPYFPNAISACLFAILIFTLPPFEAIVGWAICFYISIALFLASCAAHFAFQSSLIKPFCKSPINKYSLLASLFLFSSLAIYQFAAMFYWVMVCFFILSSSRKPYGELRHQILKFFCIGLGTIAIYAFFLNIINPYNVDLNPNETMTSYNPYTIKQNYLLKLDWFIMEPLFNSLNLWDIIPHNIDVAVTIFLFILVTYLFSLIKITWLSAKRQTTVPSGRITFNLLITISLILLTFMPGLFNVGLAPFYRCSSALTTLVVIGLLWAINEWLSILKKSLRDFVLTAIVVWGCLFGMIQANFNVYYYRALPSNLEVTFLKKILQKQDTTKFQRIYIRRPPHLMIRRYDEFANLTMHTEQDIPWLLKCIFEELGEKTVFKSIYPNITNGFNPQPPPSDKPTLIINTYWLYHFYEKLFFSISPSVAKTVPLHDDQQSAH